ncbi:hypothetical protein BC828DRAFT_409923, partial [Blastocladiella britannica]
IVYRRADQGPVESEPTATSLRLAAAAYMDDAVFYAPTRQMLADIIARVGELNTITCIRANPKKGTVLAVNVPIEARIHQLSTDGVPIPWVGSSFRYLGMYINYAMDGTALLVQAETELHRNLAMLHRKRITGKSTVYLINSVLLPALAYSWSARHSVHQTLPSAALHARQLMALESATSLVLKQHLTDLAVMLADSGHGGIPLRCELGLLQRATRCPVSPLERPDLCLLGMRQCRKQVTWFDNLLPVMTAHQLDIADTPHAFNLATRTRRHALVTYVPQLLSLGTCTRSRWANTQQATLDAVFLEDLFDLGDAPISNNLGTIAWWVRQARHTAGTIQIVTKHDHVFAEAILQIRRDGGAHGMPPRFDGNTEPDPVNADRTRVSRGTSTPQVFETHPRVVTPAVTVATATLEVYSDGSMTRDVTHETVRPVPPSLVLCRKSSIILQ